VAANDVGNLLLPLVQLLHVVGHDRLGAGGVHGVAWCCSHFSFVFSVSFFSCSNFGQEIVHLKRCLRVSAVVTVGCGGDANGIMWIGRKSNKHQTPPRQKDKLIDNKYTYPPR